MRSRKLLYIINKYILNILLWSLILLVYVIYRLTIAFSYTLDLSNGETNNIWNVVKVASGSALYTDPTEMPYEIFQYSPLSQLPLIGLAAMLDDNSPEYVHSIQSLGRVLSLIYNLLTGLLLYLILLHRFKSSKTYAFFIGVIGVISMNHLLFSVRPDSMATVVLFTAIYFFFGWLERSKTRDLLLAAILFSIGFFVKQDVILLAFPLGLLMVLQKKIKALVQFALTGIISGMILFGIAYTFWGDTFFLSVIGGVDNPYLVSRLVAVFDRFIQLYGILISLGLLAYFYLVFKTQKGPLDAWLLFMACMAFLISFATSLKDGSWVNYYSTFILLILLVVGRFINEPFSYHLVRSMILAGLLGAGYFLFSQWYHYTSPFLFSNKSKELYFSKWDDAQMIMNITSSKTIFVGSDKHLRIFLMPNSVMPNIEYYPVSPFFDDQKEYDAPEVIVTRNDIEKSAAMNSLAYFHISANAYKLAHSHGTYNIYKYE